MADNKVTKVNLVTTSLLVFAKIKQGKRKKFASCNKNISKNGNILKKKQRKQ